MDNEQRKKMQQQLNDSELQADKANYTMNTFQEELAAAITDVAFKHFKALNEMESEHFQKFGKIISDNSWSVTMNLDGLNYEVKNKK